LSILIAKYRKRAHGAGREWALNDSQAAILFESNCCYCGAPPANIIQGKGHVDPIPLIYNGIDRRDNTQGYTPESLATEPNGRWATMNFWLGFRVPIDTPVLLD
jgi:hypothetical protein